MNYTPKYINNTCMHFKTVCQNQINFEMLLSTPIKFFFYIFYQPLAIFFYICMYLDFFFVYIWFKDQWFLYPKVTCILISSSYILVQRLMVFTPKCLVQRLVVFTSKGLVQRLVVFTSKGYPLWPLWHKERVHARLGFG
jgi:hypothetical protein